MEVPRWWSLGISAGEFVPGVVGQSEISGDIYSSSAVCSRVKSHHQPSARCSLWSLTDTKGNWWVLISLLAISESVYSQTFTAQNLSWVRWKDSIGSLLLTSQANCFSICQKCFSSWPNITDFYPHLSSKNYLQFSGACLAFFPSFQLRISPTIISE